jgi:hypothetical protein
VMPPFGEGGQGIELMQGQNLPKFARALLWGGGWLELGPQRVLKPCRWGWRKFHALANYRMARQLIKDQRVSRR